MWAHTKETQEKVTPQMALEYLKEGNARFLNNLKASRNLLKQVNQTSEGQFPFAAVLSCIDSRTSAELIFDQGLGDIFSIRIAGNVLNDDILGSMEYACGVANSKIIVVLGHSKCGAIIGACSNYTGGYLTGLLSKIKPAIDLETYTKIDRNGDNIRFVNNVSEINVQLTMDQIREKSALLRKLEKEGKIMIVGGFYEIDTGEVSFYEH
ncbi:MAG TPA: carbonic anhydrase family protein [Draconibacterium sp.]|nr:carbonic anhydrase family protein [Draconibacterium sp.]HRX12688.1 carbonic anhydrase family protein [Draconibacterium sp.]